MKLTSKMLKQMITEEINEGFFGNMFGAFLGKDKESDVVMPLDFRWGKDEIVAPYDKPDEVGYKIHKGRLYKIAKAQGYTDEEIEIIVYCRKNMPLPPGTETSKRLGGLAGTKWALNFPQEGQTKKIPVPKNFRIFYERKYVDELETLAENLSGNRWFQDLFNFLTDRGNGEFRGNYTKGELGALSKKLREPDDTYNRLLRSVGVPMRHLRKDTTRPPSFDKYLGGL